ncbi:hypothetical protein CgunFtcFv8_022519 [Champsocephalus gunnari]|uniref:Uncharacterized protein n=1 Tax=Champsocephalus gunnari TaxID=52237 RepID=A0AAN8HSE9_CHAGU|nr:hypothetical protein CgunFtcFv8_022519 [Champsocephalus gunnari]
MGSDRRILTPTDPTSSSPTSSSPLLTGSPLSETSGDMQNKQQQTGQPPVLTACVDRLVAGVVLICSLQVSANNEKSKRMMT